MGHSHNLQVFEFKSTLVGGTCAKQFLSLPRLLSGDPPVDLGEPQLQASGKPWEGALSGLSGISPRSLQGRLPVRWMAIESLNYSVYTTNSDV